MKRVKMIALVLLLLTVATGCTRSLSLHQPESEILQIDLIYSPFNEYEILYSLNEEEFPAFLDALLKIKLHKSTSPHNIGGGLIVQIVYKDGSAELIGSWSVGYRSGDVLEHDGWYSASVDDLSVLFSEYVDISQRPYR